jgi:hypothetical protein
MKSCYGITLNTPPVNVTCPAPPIPLLPPLPTITLQGSYTTKTEGGRTYYTITESALLTVNRATDIQYFAIGGAGGSGRANGAGAGGVQTSIKAICAYPSQYNPLNFVTGSPYKIGVGAGGGKNGGDTIIYGKGVSMTAMGGAMGGYTGVYCPASQGGCGGGGCPSTGLQGGSTNMPPSSPISNAGAGAGGPPPDYNNGGPGINFAGKIYGVGGSSFSTTVGQANTGNGGSNGGGGGSGVVIISVPSTGAN